MKRSQWKYYDKIHEHRGKVPKIPQRVGRRFCWEQEVKLARFLGIPVRRLKIEWHPNIGEHTIYVDGYFFDYVDNLSWGGKYITNWWRVTSYLGLTRRFSPRSRA